MVVRGRCRTCIAAPSAAVSTALCSACMRRTLQASACSWSKHMPSCTSLMSVCGSMFFAKGSVSGSRIQHRESCRAALPKPASWRYRHTAHTHKSEGPGQSSRRMGGGKGYRDSSSRCCSESPPWRILYALHAPVERRGCIRWDSGRLGCAIRGRRGLEACRRIEGYLPCELQLLSARAPCTVHSS
jgi:hypothetical protein